MSDEPTPASGSGDVWGDPSDGAASPSFKPLSREDAARLRAQHPPVTPARIVALQAVVGVTVALIGWWVTGRSEIGGSLLYGAAAIVLPGALMAWGVGRSSSRGGAGASAVSFLSWETVKIGGSVVLLALAPRIVSDLSWLALIVAMVACTKVYWLALAWRRRAH